MEKYLPGGHQSPGLLSRRNLFVAVIMGGLGLLTILLGLHFRIPATGICTDPREIFVTIGAALCGPVGGSIVGMPVEPCRSRSCPPYVHPLIAPRRLSVDRMDIRAVRLSPAPHRQLSARLERRALRLLLCLCAAIAVRCLVLLS